MLDERLKIDAGAVLCYCNQVKVGDFLRLAEENAGRPLEQVMQEAHVGNKCTACLLDAEYIFVEATREGIFKHGKTAKEAPKLPLRKKLWKLLDRISPASSFPLGEVSPVIRGQHLRTSICVANDSLLFGDKVKAPPLQLNWSVYDSSGTERSSNSKIVSPGESVKLPLSDALEGCEPNSFGLIPGYVRLTRKFLFSGVRGTTRPQIVLEGDDGCCAVHVQGMIGGGVSEFNILSRDNSERVFLSIINSDTRPIKFEASCDVVLEQVAHTEWKQDEISIPTGHCRIFEVKAGNHRDEQGRPLQAFLTWRVDGLHKSHMIAANNKLSRFSIDHS